MGLGDFWLKSNNGQKFNPDAYSGEILKEDLTGNSQWQKILSLFDVNRDEKLENSEMQTLWNAVKNKAKSNGNSVFETAEAEQVLNSRIGINGKLVSLKEIGITKEGLMSFISKIFKNTQSIESTLKDGNKKVVTTYKDGTSVTVVYYPDGEIKSRQVSKLIETKVSENQFGTQSSLQETRENLPTEYSDRAKKEILSLIIEHFAQSVSQNKEILDNFNKNKTLFDMVGTFITAKRGDLKEIMELAEGDAKILEKLSKADVSKISDAEIEYLLAFADGGKLGNIDYEKFDKFAETSQTYALAYGMKTRISMLEKGIKEIKNYMFEEKMRKQGITGAAKDGSSYEKFVELINLYFEGDSEQAKIFIESLFETVGIKTSEELTPDKMYELLNEVKKATEESYKKVFGNTDFKNLQKQYEKEYEDAYGRKPLSSDLESVIGASQIAGGLYKTSFVILSMFAGGSSKMLDSAASAVAKKLGSKVTKEAVKKFSLTLGSSLENSVLDILGISTSRSGLDTEKLKQIGSNTVSMLPFSFFGAYISGPLGEKVVRALSGSSKVLGNVIGTVVSRTAGFSTEVGADVVFEKIISQREFTDICKQNAGGELFARMLNMIAGGRANAAAKMALKDVTVTPKINADGTTGYIVKANGQSCEVKTPEELTAVLVSRVITASSDSEMKFDDKNPIRVNDVDVDLKLSEFGQMLKDADLDNPDIQKQILQKFETDYPSTKNVPGRVKTLKDLQQLINSDEYLQLDSTHRQVAELVVLRTNPRIDGRGLYDDANISVEMKRQIAALENCLKEGVSSDAAAALYHEGDFETLMVLAKAKGVDELTIKQMTDAYNKAQDNGCLLINNTQINTDAVPTKTLVRDGKSYKVKVLDCTDPKVFETPEQYGLSRGTTAENMRLTVHMNDGFNQNPRMSIGKIRQAEDLNLSATRTDGNNSLYGNQQVGIGLTYDMGAVSYASNYSAGTGFGKNIEAFANAKLNLSEPSNATFVREQFLKYMQENGYNLTVKDYAVFSRQFQGKDFVTEDLDSLALEGNVNFNGKQIPLDLLKTAFAKSADDMLNVSYEMRGQTISNGMNEINVENPMVGYIYVRANSVDETLESILSPQMLEYVQKHNLTVVFQRKPLLSSDENRSVSDTQTSRRRSLPEPGAGRPKTGIPEVKSLGELTPNLKNEELKLTTSQLTRPVPNPNKPNETMLVLTKKADDLVWKAAEGLRNNALANENSIVTYLKNSGLATDGNLEHRSKSLQSLHDKIQNYIIENPKATLEEAIRDVRDAVAMRTVNKSTDVRNHPEVVELVEKGDIKSAISKAVELESEYVLEGLKRIIDAMASGNAEISISRISNYMGEDGIPYFTESQLNKLRVYAESKGVNIPIISRVTDAYDRASINDVYSDDATTKIRKSGYTALQINFVTKSGDVVEWQYRGDKLNTFGEGEHIPYDLRTGKDIIGKDVVLTDLYQPIKEILTNKDIMGDDLYKEYNAYLTAHYKYLREVELGFAQAGNPPKLPEGIDERLRADNLDLIHDLGEGLKKGQITLDEALEQYELRLVRNTADNVTFDSYLKTLKETVANADIDRHEALTRLSKSAVVNYSKLAKTCMDTSGNIKNNLVVLVEKYKAQGIPTKIIDDFISRFKDENGVIDDEIFKNLNSYANRFTKEGKLSGEVMALYTAVTRKDGTCILNSESLNGLILLITQRKISINDLSSVKEITDFMANNNYDISNDFDYFVNFYLELQKVGPKNSVNPKYFRTILDSLVAKNGKVSQNTAKLAVMLSEAKILKEDTSDTLNFAKNPITGEVDAHTLTFINDVLSYVKAEGVNPAYLNTVVFQSLGAVKVLKEVDVNGTSTKVLLPDERRMKTFMSIYNSISKVAGEKYNVEKVCSVALIVNAIKNPDGTLSQQKYNLAKQLIAAKFTSNSISETLTRNSDKAGKFDAKKTNAWLKNYNSLSPAQRANLEKVEVKLENGILRQTMVFKDGSVKVYDIDSSNVNNKNEYDVEYKKSGLRTYMKIRDAVRRRSTKVQKDVFGKVESQVTILYDKDGSKIGSEYVSKGVDKAFLDVTFRDNNGKTIELASSKIDSEGRLVIKKDFPSIDGSRTQVDYIETPDGSYNSYYKITDSDENVILEEVRAYNKIDDTHFTTSFNGRTYDLKIDELKVLTVTNDKGEKVRFDLHDLTNDKLHLFEKLIKQMPGHEFFNMAKVGLTGIDTSQKKGNAYYKRTTNSIAFAENHISLSTLLHEFGHNKDYMLLRGLNNNVNNVIRNDLELRKIYMEEQKAFVKEFPTMERDMIDYFLSLDSASTKPGQGLSETIAEANAILTTPYQTKGNEFRKYYLQRYFPKTIAYIAKKINPDVYNQ